MAWSQLVDLAMTDEDKADFGYPSMDAKGPAYPPGLCLCLTGSELEKLGLDADVDVGDMVDLRAFAIVTSVHQSQRNDGTTTCRVELQVQRMAVENEMAEDMT